MKVYTKNGDKGMTSLIGGKKIEKDDIRVEAYGTIDELNSYIGLCYHYLKEDSDKEALRKIQVKLFDIGAELSSPNYKRIKNITKEEDVEELEKLVDYYTDKIEKIERRRRHPIHLNRCRLLNYLVHGTVPLFSFFALSFGLLRFLRTFVSLFL